MSYTNKVFLATIETEHFSVIHKITKLFQMFQTTKIF